MKMHNFMIRGNCLEIVGRIVRKGEKNVPVYDIEFPDGMDGMSIEELIDVIRRIEEDICDLFYYDNNIRNDTLRRFDDSWSEGGEDDAHGA